MKRSKKYQKLKENKIVDKELVELKQKCNYLVQKVLQKCEINKKDLFIALAIRLKLPIDNCHIDNFDKEMLKKAIKELDYML